MYFIKRLHAFRLREIFTIFKHTLLPANSKRKILPSIFTNASKSIDLNPIAGVINMLLESLQ